MRLCGRAAPSRSSAPCVLPTHITHNTCRALVGCHCSRQEGRPHLGNGVVVGDLSLAHTHVGLGALAALGCAGAPAAVTMDEATCMSVCALASSREQLVPWARAELLGAHKLGCQQA